MKKILFYCMFPLMLFACKKDHKPTQPPNNGNKTYTVHFNVNATATSSLKTNSVHSTDADTPVPVSSFANKLQYWVYDSTGALITQLIQNSTSANFGQITDTFKPGTYNIVIIAQNTNAFEPGTLTVPAIFSGGNILLNGTDTFFETFPITVTDAAITQDVTLQRVDGQLQIVITDSIPTSATKINLVALPGEVIKISTGLPILDPNNGNPLTLSVPLPDSVKGKKNFTITTYVANTPAVPFTVTLTGYSGNTVVATAKIDSVTCQTNTRTILSGNLFLHIANVGFTINFNDTWNSTPVIIPFKQRPSPVIN